MIRRTVTLTAIVAVTALAYPTPASAVVSRYIDTPRNEFWVAVDAGVHAWSVDTPAHPYVYRVWVKPSGGSAYAVSAPKANAAVGDIDLSNPTFGDVLVYSAAPDLGRGQRDIRLWDLANHEFLSVPAGINTPNADETRPTIGGDYLVFERIKRTGSDSLFLYRFSTHTFRLLARTTPQQLADMEPRVNGDYAVYHVCPVTNLCNVFRRQLSTGTTRTVPNPGRADYSPAVTTSGTVFYIQGSPRYCGHHSKIMSWTGSGSPTLLVALPERVEAGVRDVYDDGVSATLYFTRVRCVGSHYGIYQLPGV
jgi:hypothetical protein